MADVRSMLKQQRAARQQAKAPKQSASAPKKRKAADDAIEERKRTKTEETASTTDPVPDTDAVPEPEAPLAAHEQQPVELPDAVEAALPPPAADAELDAFMAEMDQAAVDAERNPSQRNVPLYSSAVIESAPMTAAQLAAQAREEQIAQRARRDEEMEGEKEDAARALEDEFEEMDGLEERVKKLREQREALRAKHAAAEVRQEEDVLPTPRSEGGESDSDDADEDWDDWRFRAA